jgi:general stress protein 26
MAQQDKAEKLWDLIKDIEMAMLTTEDEQGKLRSRPMATIEPDDSGEIWFFTRASSHKVSEVEHDARVCVTYAEPSKQDYVSLSGRAKLVRDKAQIKAHWTEGLRTWFPKGQDDPDIAILEVRVEMAEYWDAPSSTMVHAYGYVKAVATGKPPSPGENEKVRLS